MVGCTRRPRKRAEVRFAEPPWDERSDEWQVLDQQVAADHRAREVVEAMKQLDWTPLFALYLGVGLPPIRPDLMLAIVLIEIRMGRPRPSQWFRDTKENMVLQWAGFGIRPSRACWYDFADRVAPLLERWNAEVLQLARQRGVTQAERMSLDGTSVAANASRHRLVNEATIEKRLAELDIACQADAAAQPPPNEPAWMAKHPDTREGQRRRYRRARERLVELHAVNNRQDPKKRRKPEKIVVSTSDPEAALGRDKHNVFRPLYNVQLVRDLDSQLCLGYQVFAQPTDAGTFSPMLERVANWTGVKPKAMLVDAGYVTACNLAICDQGGIALYGPWQENDFSKKKKKEKQDAKPRPIGKEHFTWLPEQNMYRCPEGHPMPWIGQEKRRQSDGQINVVHSYRCSPQHCRACPRQVACSTNPNRGRAVKRSEHEALVEAHRTRMATAEAKSLYRLRGQTVELGFADFKQHRSLRQFSGRGPYRAQRQVGLTVLAHNLLVVHRAMPPPENPATAVLTIEEITT
ncbi:MAG TPA: IS1182 family transposase [Thermoguttaceae bacterium]|nr:IS1182 family transposase [Thermoguttaceae bacterium]